MAAIVFHTGLPTAVKRRPKAPAPRRLLNRRFDSAPIYRDNPLISRVMSENGLA
jgi:hypothetical protein